MTTNYFRYLPLQNTATIWGAAISAAGYTRVSPHASYPPSNHPTNRSFSWEGGRKLDALQIVLIETGKGVFETERSGLQLIESDTAFVLFPGVRHRYKPDSEVGWTESWIEVQGPLVERLCRQHDFMSIGKSVVCAENLIGLEESLNEVHRLLRRDPVDCHAELSALAIRILAIWTDQGRSKTNPDPSARGVARAEAWLAEHVAEQIDMAELARKLGMSYSHFRRVFKIHTGVAPWQYLLHLRLAKARQLFVNDRITLADAAERLGFNSAFHLSSAFKNHYGKSPLHWKRDLHRTFSASIVAPKEELLVSA
ncbi:MAG: helix-turn-helix transcriptional regulator [Opitutae bacterium]|nr:helix-turn-helix transcriptional regulator [Opitutae bacterium]